MSEQYLWDGTGEPDPHVASIEETLECLRWSGKQPDLQPAIPISRWYEQRNWAMAAAALVVVCLWSSFFLLQRHSNAPATSWQLSRSGQEPSAVHSGQVIETGPNNERIESESIGEIDIAPDSRLRVLTQNARHNRLALDHGTIHAFIWAPPANFVVDTPAAKTVDLGCSYTLSVDPDGTGFLQVEMGWVAFESNKVESFIPEGAVCFTRVGHGPDTPYFRDAPRAFTKALIEFDTTGYHSALETVLKEARPRDGLTLWHLLERTQGAERSDVYARFSELVRLPPTMTRDGVLRGDPKSMDAAWNALQLGDTSRWREWKRNW